MSYSEEKEHSPITFGESGNQLVLLTAFALISYVLLAFMKMMWLYRFPPDIAIGLYYNDIYNQFALSNKLQTLLQRPWTILTFMFVQNQIWEIITNLLWLWCFGYILQQKGSNKKLFPLFIYGSIGAAILFLFAYHFIPSLSTPGSTIMAAGTSAGVTTIAIATTLLFPKFKIFPMIGGGIPIWILTLLYIASVIITGYANTTYLILIGGGTLTAIVYFLFYRSGYDWAIGMNKLFDWVGDLFNPDAPSKKKNMKNELFYHTDKEPFIRKPNPTEQRINAILDKINEQGMSSLTAEEKELLKSSGNSNK